MPPLLPLPYILRAFLAAIKPIRNLIATRPRKIASLKLPAVALPGLDPESWTGEASGTSGTATTLPPGRCVTSPAWTAILPGRRTTKLLGWLNARPASPPLTERLERKKEGERQEKGRSEGEEDNQGTGNSCQKGLVFSGSQDWWCLPRNRGLALARSLVATQRKGKKGKEIQKGGNPSGTSRALTQADCLNRRLTDCRLSFRAFPQTTPYEEPCATFVSF